MNDIEAEMLRRQQEREARAKEQYNLTFYPKLEAPAFSSEAESRFIKTMIATPASEPQKRMLVMYSGTNELKYANLKDCADKTGLQFQKIKGALRSSSSLYCKLWKCDVMFKFIYE